MNILLNFPKHENIFDDASLDFFSLFKVNQERMNSLFVPAQFASSLTDGILLFYSGSNCKKDDRSY